MGEGGEWREGERARAERDEADESEGGISTERLSKISGLLGRGEQSARPSRSTGLRGGCLYYSQAIQPSPHVGILLAAGEGESASDSTHLDG